MRPGEFELDLALDGINEAIKAITGELEARRDRDGELEVARHTLYEAAEALIAAGNEIFASDSGPDGCNDTPGIVF